MFRTESMIQSLRDYQICHSVPRLRLTRRGLGLLTPVSKISSDHHKSPIKIVAKALNKLLLLSGYVISKQ